MCKIVAVVLCFIIADFTLGLIQAFKNKTFKSSVMREGLMHKAAEILVIALAALCEWALPVLGIEVTIHLVATASLYICVMELASCVENLGAVSPEIGAIVVKIFGPYLKEEKKK